MLTTLLKQWRSIIGLAGITVVSIGVGFASASSSVSNSLPEEEADSKFKVAIIGTGIGGSSAAYFIHNLLGRDASIDVFDRASKVGGRIAVIEMDDNMFESGGSVIHDSNKYMTEFCKMGGFGKLHDDTDSTMGIYDGKEFLFKSTGYSILDKIKLFFRYGFGLLKMDSLTSETVKKFEKIYNLQDKEQSFETAFEFMNTLGGDAFLNLTKNSAKKILLERGISEKIIDELATAVTRCNYGQDMHVNAFTGFVSLAGAQSSKLWAVKGGNYQVCKYALESSKANIMLDTKVHSISKQKMKDDGVKYAVVTDATDANHMYDAVVVAVPLAVKSAQIECKACTNWPSAEELGYYQRTVTTFVKGKLNHTAFGISSEKDVPYDIFTVENPDLSFSSIGRQKNIEGKSVESGGKHIYKVFSRDILTGKQLNDLFSQHSKVKVVDWLAYPHYSPPEKLTSFRLDDGVFYVNAIERVASAMEMSAIGGRNAALLTARYLKGKKERSKMEDLQNTIKAEL